MSKLSENSVLIIGGGPAGLSVALMLAKRGWSNITVLEKRPSANYYESDKAFSYQIDGRGQKLTDFLGFTEKLAAKSVPSTEFYFTVIDKNGKRKTTQLPIVDAQRKTAYWLPRAEFLQVLYEEIIEKYPNNIQVLFNTECLSIEKKSDYLEVICQSNQQGEFSFYPNFLIGCDGINSIVRSFLQEIEEDKTCFQVLKFPSPSSELLYKILSLKPQFPLSEQAGDLSQSSMAYVIRSVFQDRHKKLSLGLLPFKNSLQPRTANIITYRDHYIWQLKTPKEFEQFLKESFPQLPLDKIVPPEEFARFMASKGGKFPIPQYCPQFWKILEESGLNSPSKTAILLLGDAIHSFPPDLGQGVNSALEDIYLLKDLLNETKDDLSQALPRYQELRLPDVKALIRLVQVSYPWQYNQNLFQKRLWNINFLLRLVLSRLFPFLFSPHSFLLIQNHELSYSEILAKSNRTTLALGILGGLVLLSCLVLSTWT
ncbi:FAD-dependent oxidoreductase [Gloeothece verrucosa]|uniref:FAD dependent oxidoreductase n=1 Tax=Gloeothece verrucosa (strain PCC 7822) TaxID=497965 RepID=E0UL98_GLOV7|nr:NAD(P)/FAD-dependent oxidoreductase [Gloeothece verrucosa]ADN17728.1 FAD dependent oxidoreductase [Gloeothece verrucosa PCC 7822]